MATAFALGVLGIGITKVSLKHILKPRKSRITKTEPPYETLCISAIFAQLAYKSKDDFMTSAATITHQYPTLKNGFERTIFENEEDLEMLDASKEKEEENAEEENEEVKRDCQDTQVFMWIRNGMAYVVFRGTESKGDILANLDVRRSSFTKKSGVLVHRGFSNQFFAIEKKLTEYLSEFRFEYTEITFIGHSLGMACCILASLYYEEYFAREEQCPESPVIHCHGFGGPRVGNKKFASYFAKHTRLKNNTWQIKAFEDIVTMIPFSHRFCHIASPTLYFHNGKMHFTDKRKDNPWYFRPFLILTKMNVLNVTEAHSLDKYIESLFKQCIED